MQIGFAVSTGILITSLVMATLLVPSLTALLGQRAWWPGRRDQQGPRRGGDDESPQVLEPVPVRQAARR